MTDFILSVDFVTLLPALGIALTIITVINYRINRREWLRSWVRKHYL